MIISVLPEEFVVSVSVISRTQNGPEQLKCLALALGALESKRMWPILLHWSDLINEAIVRLVKVAHWYQLELVKYPNYLFTVDSLKPVRRAFPPTDVYNGTIMLSTY
jgi:hypothetical protein